MANDFIRKKLFALQDKDYGEFQKKLIPDTKTEIIGVRTPALRALAKELKDTPEADAFLDALPHRYFDEYQLHAFIISLDKDYSHCLQQVDALLPHIDNWATCDQLSPKVFAKHKEELLPEIRRWMAADPDRQTYTVRFGIGMLMQHFLDDTFDPQYPEWVAEIRSEQYYIKMMIAWYFATALAKQWDACVPYIEQRRLDRWTHNKAIQKSVESYRITADQKTYLKTLKY